MDVSFGEIAAALLPRTDNPIILILDVMLYIMFFLNLLAFFMQDDKQVMATILMGVALLTNVIGKMSTYFNGPRRVNPIEFLEADNLTMLIVNCGVFVIPFIVTGMSKAKKPKPLTIIAGFIGMFYFGMFWFFLQYNA